MPLRLLLRVFVLLLASLTLAQTPELSKAVQEFVRVNAGKVVLTHVRVIDGTGAAAVEDQNVVLESGKITAIERGADVVADKSTAVLDLRGYTVMPGIVGMHDHLFYIARPNLDFLRAASLSGRRRHHHAHHRQRRAVLGFEPQARYRCRQASRPSSGRYRTLSRG